MGVCELEVYVIAVETAVLYIMKTIANISHVNCITGNKVAV